MGASAIEFRLRMLILVIIVSLGFWAPWIEAFNIGSRISLLEWLALQLSRLGVVRFTVATPSVIVIAAASAAVAVVLRVWGTAYLGTATVNHAEMKAGTVLADGPYRYVRNPLYLGVSCMFLAMAFIMPPTGALFAMVLSTLFLLRLILGEEAFLRAKLGDRYRTYLAAVPRILPRLRTNLQRTGAPAQWTRAILAEINVIGVFVTLAFLSWTYDNWLMIKAVLISLGISIVVRGFLPKSAA